MFGRTSVEEMWDSGIQRKERQKEWGGKEWEKSKLAQQKEEVCLMFGWTLVSVLLEVLHCRQYFGTILVLCRIHESGICPHTTLPFVFSVQRWIMSSTSRCSAVNLSEWRLQHWQGWNGTGSHRLRGGRGCYAQLQKGQKSNIFVIISQHCKTFILFECHEGCFASSAVLWLHQQLLWEIFTWICCAF